MQIKDLCSTCKPCFLNGWIQFFDASKQQTNLPKKNKVRHRTIFSIVNELSRNEKNWLFFSSIYLPYISFCPISRCEREKLYEKIWERRKQMFFCWPDNSSKNHLFYFYRCLQGQRITSKGLTSNGLTSNGPTSNGPTSNGPSSNGVTSNELSSKNRCSQL